MASRVEKSFSEAVEQRRATPSFDGMPIPDADLVAATGERSSTLGMPQTIANRGASSTLK